MLDVLLAQAVAAAAPNVPVGTPPVCIEWREAAQDAQVLVVASHPGTGLVGHSPEVRRLIELRKPITKAADGGDTVALAELLKQREKLLGTLQEDVRAKQFACHLAMLTSPDPKLREQAIGVARAENKWLDTVPRAPASPPAPPAVPPHTPAQP